MFDEFIKKVLKECDGGDGGAMTDAGVYGAVGADYAAGDNRIPNVMGPMLRRNKKRRNHKKRK